MQTDLLRSKALSVLVAVVYAAAATAYVATTGVRLIFAEAACCCLLR